MTAKQAKAFGIDPPSPRKKKKEQEAVLRVRKDEIYRQMSEKHGLPAPVLEYPFAKSIGRNWCFDMLYDGWLAIEINGGNFSGGRHAQGAALRDEYEKINHAALLGYAVLIFLPEQIDDGSAFPFIKRVLEGEQ